MRTTGRTGTTARMTGIGRPGGGERRSRTRRYGAGLTGFPELWNEEGAEVTLRIDSKLLAAAESEDPRATRKEAAEELRRRIVFDGGCLPGSRESAFAAWSASTC